MRLHRGTPPHPNDQRDEVDDEVGIWWLDEPKRRLVKIGCTVTETGSICKAYAPSEG
jgi:hypothetical protein